VNVETKVCRGPAHAQPERVPLDEQHWHFYRSGERTGRPLSRCKLCRHWDVLQRKGGPHGYVETKLVLPHLTELVARTGNAARVEIAHGISARTVRMIVKGETKSTQKQTALRVLAALAEQRKLDRRNGTRAGFNAAIREQVLRSERIGRLAGY
jgi:hypothetical protein